MPNNLAVFGASGAIGNALTQRMAKLYPSATIHAFSRKRPVQELPNVVYRTIDYRDEASIEESACCASRDALLDTVIVATGILHDSGLMPEKSLRDLSAANFQRVFDANMVVPALIAKHALPRMSREGRPVFAALSARVGSISDNRLGGWYAYRASKAALNMVIRNAAIEIARRDSRTIVVGLHPGTVDSNLSRPFQKNVPAERLFSPEYSAKRLLEVIGSLTPEQSGKCFAWDGKEIAP